MTLAGLWILLAAVWLGLYPLLTGRWERSALAHEIEELESEKARLVGEIHDLELDRATGKLSDKDYRDLEADLKARAVEVMREIDAKAPPTSGRSSG